MRGLCVSIQIQSATQLPRHPIESMLYFQQLVISYNKFCHQCQLVNMVMLPFLHAPFWWLSRSQHAYRVLTNSRKESWEQAHGILTCCFEIITLGKPFAVSRIFHCLQSDLVGHVFSSLTSTRTSKVKTFTSAALSDYSTSLIYSLHGYSKYSTNAQHYIEALVGGGCIF